MPLSTFSPLDEYIEEIRTLHSQGLGSKTIADELETTYGVRTSKDSVRRALRRHQILAEERLNEATRDIPWGYGRPKPVEPAAPDELVVGLYDQHFPYEEPALIKAALELIKDVQPNRIILGGDGVDLFLLSRFYDGTSRIESLQEDIDKYSGFVSDVRKAAPNAKLDVVDSNHESRLMTFLQKSAPQLQSLRALNPKVLLGYEQNDVSWHPGAGFLLRNGENPFLVKHGSKVSSVPGGTARAEAMNELCSGISGHAHRAEFWTRQGATNSITWTVSGTMSRLDADYIAGAVNWNQGIVVLEISQTGNNVVHQVPYVHGCLRLGLKAY